MIKSKWCWLVKQYRRGWRVGLCIGETKPRWIDFWFANTKDVEKVLHRANGKIVFVEMDK